MSLSVEEVQTFLSTFLLLIAEERIQRELDGTTPKEKALCITLLLNLLYFQSMFSVYILPLYLCFASIKNNLIRISVPPDYIKYVSLYEHVMNLLKKTND